MKSVPTDLIVIEEAVAAKIAAVFQPIANDLSAQIALKCKIGDWAGAYLLCDQFNLMGAISTHEKDFQQTALAAVLFGAANATDLESTDLAIGKTPVPIEVFNSVAQLVHMIEQNAADVIRDTLRATIYAEEAVEKDQLHTVSKADLYALYQRWHDQDRNSWRGMLSAYINIREETELAGNPFLMSARGFDDWSPSIDPLCNNASSDGTIEVGDEHSPSGLQIGSSSHESAASALQRMSDRDRDQVRYDSATIGDPVVMALVRGWNYQFPIDFYHAVKSALRGRISGSLYVHRDLLNHDDIAAWASDQGFSSILPDGDMHVTLCYSKTPVEGVEPLTDNVHVTDGYRKVSQFGDATVIEFGSDELQTRNRELMDAGATSNFDQYHPHVTITYDSPLHISGVKPYDGPLIFGPEIHGEVKEDWADDLVEAAVKAETAEEPELSLAEKLNEATLGTGKKLFDLAANLTTSRLITFGFLSQIQGTQSKYQVNEVLDDKTCPFCQYMHGKVFAVAHEYGKSLATLGTSDPKELKGLAPWPDQSKAGIKAIKEMTNAQLQAAGYGSPPYHPHCRGFLTLVGAVGPVDENGNLKEQAQAIIDGLGPDDTQVVDDATSPPSADIPPEELVDDETVAANKPATNDVATVENALSGLIEEFELPASPVEADAVPPVTPIDQLDDVFNIPDNAVGDHTPAANFIEDMEPDDEYQVQQAIYRITNLEQQQKAQDLFDDQNWAELGVMLDKLHLDPAVFTPKANS